MPKWTESERSTSKPQLEPGPGRPLSIRTIVIGGGLLAVVGAVAVALLLYFYGGGTEREKAGLDVVRTAGTLLVGTGGAVALLLAARRQRYTELTLEHQREVAAANQRDIAEQRLTELYTRAVDQLGNAQAPVRLGGLYALERLAQNNPDQRQTIVDVICAYLRMPYMPPGKPLPTDIDLPGKTRSDDENRRQELQVRLTAQRILSAHLKLTSADSFWPGVDLDLSEAHLYKLDLSDCQMRRVRFSRALFSEDTWFNKAQFNELAQFSEACFEEGETHFNEARFRGVAFFNDVQFGGVTEFDLARFGTRAFFNNAQFGAVVRFTGTQLESAWFDGARARPHLRNSWPEGWTTRDPAQDDEDGWVYFTRNSQS